MVVAGVAFFIQRESAREAAQYQEQHEGLRSSRANVFAAGDLGEMLSLCREGWEAQAQLHHDPVAIAWTRRGVDAYFFDGTDSSSLRQVRCDAEGVSRGPRVDHPLAAQLPAKRPPARRSGPGWPAALIFVTTLRPDDLAFELVRHRPRAADSALAQWLSGRAPCSASGRTLVRLPAVRPGLRPSRPRLRPAPGPATERWLGSFGILLLSRAAQGARVRALR
jgi:hypothetical protein